MEAIVGLLSENALLIAGLVMSLVVIGLRKVAEKTETKLDDQGVELVEKNKEKISAKLAELIKKLLNKKK